MGASAAIFGAGGLHKQAAPHRTTPARPGVKQPATLQRAGRASSSMEQRQRALLVARAWVLAMLGVFALLGVTALAKILWIGVVEPPAARQSLADALLPDRGEITDRRGVTLARDLTAYALWFNPAVMTDGGPPLVRPVAEVADELIAIFPDLERDEVIAVLSRRDHGAYLRRRILPEEANRVNALGEPALQVPQESDRHYPEGTLAAHVVGYVDRSGRGMLGMERARNSYLTDDATRGQPVALSIDVRVQGALEDELRRGMLSTNARGAAGIVLDVDSGEVLAMASLPDFDPNAVQADDVILPEARMQMGEMPRAFNRVTNQIYELGSTFKPLTIAAAIDAGVVTDLSRRWPARPLQMGSNTIRDSHDLGATLNVPETLIQSSNIVSAQIAGELGGARMRDYFARLGMAERPVIELAERGRPFNFGEDWSRTKAMYVGFGHDIAVTPLHLASAYAAMVNGGVWRPATLLRRAPGTPLPRGRRVFQPSTSARMNQLLRMVALYGTGANADAEGYRVGGKTGSAEKSGVTGPYRNLLVSTFAAAFPMDRPRYVVIAMLDEPQQTAASSFQRTAAWNSAPIVGRLIPRIGPQLGVVPDARRDIDITDLVPLVPGRH